MARYRDSVGNTYDHVPPPKHPPKQGPGKSGKKKIGRNKRKPSFMRWKARNPLK